MKDALIPITIVGFLFAAITVIIVAYFWLLGRRAEAAANAEYRRLAEQAVADQAALHKELGELTTRLTAVERLLRSVDNP